MTGAHPKEVAGSLRDVAHEAGWVSAEQPSQWIPISRAFRDGSTQEWWALEIVAGPYGPGKTERAVVTTTDPKTLPDLTTWYLVTNLATPTESSATELLFPKAHLAEVIRLYGLRMWVEQSYKQVKHAASVVSIPGAQRQSYSPALAACVLRFLLLLVSCQSSCFQHGRRAPEAS
jgi:hypothetical protein